MRETAQRGGRMQQTSQSQCVFLRIRFTFKGSCEMPQRRRGNQLWKEGTCNSLLRLRSTSFIA